MRGFDLGTMRNRLQGTAATALALLAIALLFVHFVPRRAEIAAALAEARRDAAVVPVESPAAADRAGPEGEAAATVPETPPPDEAAAAPPPAEPGPATTPTARPPPPAGSKTRLLARPVALDTATILIGRGKVRLAGIAAVPLDRRCGAGRASWFCGVEARTQFRAWLRSRSIACEVPDDFGGQMQEVVSTCSLAGEDLGGWLVAQGWASAEAGGPYAEAEALAKTGRLGIWAERRPGT